MLVKLTSRVIGVKCLAAAVATILATRPFPLKHYQSDFP